MQCDLELLKKKLEQELIQKVDLEEQIKTLNAEHESSNKKVILFLVNLDFKIFSLIDYSLECEQLKKKISLQTNYKHKCNNYGQKSNLLSEIKTFCFVL